MGSKGGGSSESTIRLAPYVEAAHIELLENYQTYRAWALIPDPVKGLYNWDYSGGMISDPFRDYVAMEVEDAFFGAGFSIASFPSLYTLYSDMMRTVDIDALFNEIFADTVNGTVVDNLVSTEASILSDDIEQVALPRFECGMRDINSVISSSFVIGRSLMEAARTKAISRFSADIKGRLLPLVTDRWKASLEWGRGVTEMYAQLLKFYLIAKIDVENQTFEVRAKHALWPFTILEYERSSVAVLVGTQNTKTEVAGTSKLQSILGSVFSGLGAIGQLFGGGGEGGGFKFPFGGGGGGSGGNSGTNWPTINGYPVYYGGNGPDIPPSPERM